MAGHSSVILGLILTDLSVLGSHLFRKTSEESFGNQINQDHNILHRV